MTHVCNSTDSMPNMPATWQHVLIVRALTCRLSSVLFGVLGCAAVWRGRCRELMEEAIAVNVSIHMLAQATACNCMNSHRSQREHAHAKLHPQLRQQRQQQQQQQMQRCMRCFAGRSRDPGRQFTCITNLIHVQGHC